MTTTGDAVVSGAERLEVLAIMGRPTRMGEPSELSVSDAARVLDAIAAGDVATAGAYVDYLQPHYAFMVVGSFEWAIRWPDHVQRTSGEKAVAIRRAAWEGWVDRMREMQGDAAQVLRRLLEPGAEPTPDALLPAIGGLMQGQMPAPDHALSALLAGPMQAFAAVRGGLGEAEAADRFREFQSSVRARHDLLIGYVDAFMGAILEHESQEACEEAIRATFHGCSFYAPMQQLAAALAPAELVVVLAEHMRHHFSGPAREGRVEVIDEGAAYRLRFDACGSGGALRRAEGRRLPVLPGASEATWQRAGEVPAYCSHCAMNEAAQIDRVGRPLWVTDFDPDGARPCSWVVYKDPAAVPASYFERLGRKKRA